MSNSFEPHGDPVEEARRTPLIRLLLAMAREWASIATDVESLGAIVARVATADGSEDSIRELQAVDLIQQRAQGQANLLTRLTRKIADDQLFDRRRLAELVEDIPFQSVRESLQAAYEGRDHAGPASLDDNVDWF
jgi:hypothetical protein